MVKPSKCAVNKSDGNTNTQEICAFVCPCRHSFIYFSTFSKMQWCIFISMREINSAPSHSIFPHAKRRAKPESDRKLCCELILLEMVAEDWVHDYWSDKAIDLRIRNKMFLFWKIKSSIIICNKTFAAIRFPWRMHSALFKIQINPFCCDALIEWDFWTFPTSQFPLSRNYCIPLAKFLPVCDAF